MRRFISFAIESCVVRLCHERNVYEVGLRGSEVSVSCWKQLSHKPTLSIGGLDDEIRNILATCQSKSS